jgi:hypothetical protein
MAMIHIMYCGYKCVCPTPHKINPSEVMALPHQPTPTAIPPVHTSNREVAVPGDRKREVVGMMEEGGSTKTLNKT